MSDDEKARQLGAAVADLQAARVNLAHIEEKLRRTAAAYSAAAAAISTRLGLFYEVQFEAGQLVFGQTGSVPPAHQLLDEIGLSDLVRGRDEARSAVETARHRVNQLGVTCI